MQPAIKHYYISMQNTIFVQFVRTFNSYKFWFSFSNIAFIFHIYLKELKWKMKLIILVCMSIKYRQIKILEKTINNFAIRAILKIIDVNDHKLNDNYFCFHQQCNRHVNFQLWASNKRNKCLLHSVNPIDNVTNKMSCWMLEIHTHR